MSEIACYRQLTSITEFSSRNSYSSDHERSDFAFAALGVCWSDRVVEIDCWSVRARSTGFVMAGTSAKAAVLSVRPLSGREGVQGASCTAKTGHCGASRVPNGITKWREERVKLRRSFHGRGMGLWF